MLISCMNLEYLYIMYFKIIAGFLRVNVANDLGSLGIFVISRPRGGRHITQQHCVSRVTTFFLSVKRVRSFITQMCQIKEAQKYDCTF